MHEAKGKFFLMIIQLMTEYNPEVVDGKITMDLTMIDPEGWIDGEKLIDIFHLLSTEAIEVLGKRAIGVINSTTDALKGFTNPQKILKLLPFLYKENTRGEEAGSYEIMENKDRYFKIKDSTPYPEGVVRGLAWGLLELLNVKVVSRETINENTYRIHEIKYGV